MKVIIIEGMDGCGKTTLQENLTSTLNGRIITHHFMFPKGETIEEQYAYQHGQFDSLFMQLDKINDRDAFDFVILDRSHLGEYVWGPFYRHKFPKYLPALEHTYKHLDIYTILVTGKQEIIKERWDASRKEIFPDHFEYIQDLFHSAIDMSPFKSIILDSTVLTPAEEMLNATLQFIGEIY